jgi:hypothetical protein
MILSKKNISTKHELTYIMSYKLEDDLYSTFKKIISSDVNDKLIDDLTDMILLQLSDIIFSHMI